MRYESFYPFASNQMPPRPQVPGFQPFSGSMPNSMNQPPGPPNSFRGQGQGPSQPTQGGFPGQGQGPSQPMQGGFPGQGQGPSQPMQGGFPGQGQGPSQPMQGGFPGQGQGPSQPMQGGFPGQGQDPSQSGQGPSKIDSYMQTANQFLNTAQQFAPVVQQFAPMMRNIPAMWRLYKGFQSLPSAGEQPTGGGQGAARASSQPIASNTDSRPSGPRIFQPPGR